MKTKLLLFLCFMTLYSSAQTFDWESANIFQGIKVRQIVNGIQAIYETSSGNALLLNNGFGGSTGKYVTPNTSVTSVTVTFSVPINIQTIYTFDGNLDVSANWTFTPTGGNNNSITGAIGGQSGGFNINANWTNVTSFTITSNSSNSNLDNFSLDNIVFTPVCNVNIPDANFKTALLNHNPIIDINGDNEIQCSEANNFNGAINVNNLNISDLTGLEAFVDIFSLSCENNQLSSIDTGFNTKLIEIFASNNLLTNIDVSNNLQLIQLFFSDNQVSNVLDLSQHLNIQTLNCSNNQIAGINIANGQNTAIVSNFFITTGNPNLNCIQVDNATYSTTNWTNIDSHTNFSTNCSLNVNEYTMGAITIYPNPVKSILTIELEEDIDRIEVYSLEGQKVLSSNTPNINVTNLFTGIYILKVNTKNGKTGVKRFVKE